MVLAGISLRGGISCNMASCWADATRSLIYYVCVFFNLSIYWNAFLENLYHEFYCFSV